ncbi:MAG: AhpC/TSA family protein [Bacteroidia bacterium]|nr:AhpC/TSA family protein [Bacteroidia bacterium]
MGFKSLILSFLFLFTVLLGYARREVCRIEGDVKNLGDDVVYLRDIWSGENLDTAFAKGGKFIFELRLSQPVYVSFVWKNNSMAQFFIESNSLQLLGDVKNTAAFSLTGSSAQIQWLAFSNQWQSFLKGFLQKNGVSTLQLPDSLWFPFQQEVSVYLKRYFAQKNTASVAAFALIQTGSFLSPEVKKEIWNVLPAKSRKGRYAETFSAITENENRFLGEPLLDFQWKDVSGKIIEKEDFKGKFLLIDFWASWCKPCRQYNQKFKSLYAELKGEGLEILSFSLDTDLSLYEKALKEDEMTWIQVQDSKGWDTEFIKKYKIQGLPSSLLISPEGKILAKNVRPERIIAWIRK